MPELPEVETIKNALDKAVCGADILSVEVRCRRFRIDVPHNFEQKISGLRIISLKRIAKYIIVELSTGLCLIWHLGMSGRIKICTEPPQEFDKHDHIIIMTSLGTVIFNDARRFGLLTYCPADELMQHPLLAKIGKDPFDDSLTADYLFEGLQNKTADIKLMLLDQSLINGIGNIYASESLYRAGIHPERKAKSLSKQECASLISAIRQVLRNAIAAGGSTLKDYRKPDGSMGYFQQTHCVYNKTGQRCPNCICQQSQTGGIKKIVQGGRSTFYCPVKQK